LDISTYICNQSISSLGKKMKANQISHTSTSRRRFLKAGCLTIGAAGVTLCGASLVNPEPPSQKTPSYSYGEITMKEKILVTYATYAGSTVEVAAAIGKTLATNGSTNGKCDSIQIDVKPINALSQVNGDKFCGYRAVLISSAVQYATWLPEAVEFVKANQQALMQLPVALFCVHIQNTGDDETSRKNRLAYLDAVRAYLRPRSEGFFAGKFDRRGAELLLPGFLPRLVPAMDFRNWEKIRLWAENVRPLLLESV
jgi:menaquinone-dependent protoporphyrinogen oxidase